MNKERRKELEKVEALISEARNLLEEVRDGEEDALCNLPESFQMSERGEKMEDAISSMNDVLDALEEAEGSLEELRNN